MKKITKRFLIGSIKLYQKLIRPLTNAVFLSSVCRYYPTCSNYALESIERYGAVKGTRLSIKRISRCQPFVQGGFDPVT